MATAVMLLVEAVPAWLEIIRYGPDQLVGRARIASTPWAKSGLELRVSNAPTPTVSEVVKGACLPIVCPERHIQGDATFCLGLPAPKVTNLSDAENWWNLVWQFLRCQGVAVKTGVWPPAHSLDHGEAGFHHQAATNLAVQVGLIDEYTDARLGEKNWITDPKVRLFGEEGEPINGRLPCPRGCQRKARGRDIPVLRSECKKWPAMAKIAFHEEQRREKLAEFWQFMISKGFQCCKTMRSCPLNSGQAIV